MSCEKFESFQINLNFLNTFVYVFFSKQNKMSYMVFNDHRWFTVNVITVESLMGDHPLHNLLRPCFLKHSPSCFWRQPKYYFLVTSFFPLFAWKICFSACTIKRWLTKNLHSFLFVFSRPSVLKPSPSCFHVNFICFYVNKFLIIIYQGPHFFQDRCGFIFREIFRGVSVHNHNLATHACIIQC